MCSWFKMIKSAIWHFKLSKQSNWSYSTWSTNKQQIKWFSQHIPFSSKLHSAIINTFLTTTVTLTKDIKRKQPSSKTVHSPEFTPILVNVVWVCTGLMLKIYSISWLHLDLSFYSMKYFSKLLMNPDNDQYPENN